MSSEKETFEKPRPTHLCACGAVKVREWGFDPFADCIVCGAKDARADPPRMLCPDPVLGTRDGWAFCGQCGGIKEPGHSHLVVTGLVDLMRRAEFAESMLCATVFDHARMMQGFHRPNEATCYYDCALCDAARQKDGG